MTNVKKSYSAACLAALVFSLFSIGALLPVSEAHAGTVSLAGVIDYIDNEWPLSTEFSTPVSITVGWDDALVGSIGTAELTLTGGLNTLSFEMGLFAVSEADKPGSSDYYPVAHFTDGMLDGLYVDFYGMPAVIEGVEGEWSLGIYWNYKSLAPIYDGRTNFINVLEEVAYVLVDGYVVAPAPAPVPVPGALWLLGSGLVGLVGFHRRQNEPQKS